jgi:hypothetical protein
MRQNRIARVVFQSSMGAEKRRGAATQMQQRGTGLLPRGVKPLLDPGQAVDEPRDRPWQNIATAARNPFKLNRQVTSNERRVTRARPSC